MDRPPSRRTTLTLPAKCLAAAEHIAKTRHLNLSSVIGEALARGLREQEHLRRSESIIESYRKAFAEFLEEDLLLLDGIVMESPPRGRARAEDRPAAAKRRDRRRA